MDAVVEKCALCDEYSCHRYSYCSGLNVPLCRSHLTSVFRRLKTGDREVILFRCEEIIKEWQVRKRRHASRSKVSAESLREIARLKVLGHSVVSIADHLKITKALAHRYVTRLLSVDPK